MTVGKCQAIHCEKDATVVPELLAWAEGQPQEDRNHENAIRMFIDLKLCLEHGQELDPDKFMQSKTWAQVRQCAEQAGGVTPDRTSLLVNLIPLTSPDMNLRLDS